MRSTTGLKITRDDRLVRVWWSEKEQRFYIQPKRVSAACPLTAEERAVYTKGRGDVVGACRFIMDRRAIGLAEAKALLDAARSPAYLFRRRVA